MNILLLENHESFAHFWTWEGLLSQNEELGSLTRKEDGVQVKITDAYLTGTYRIKTMPLSQV